MTLLLPGSVRGDHALVENLTPDAASSTGMGPSNRPKFNVSPDGTRLFLTSRDRLTASDTDDFRDLYERSGGTTTLVTTAPVAGAQSDVFGQYFFVSDDSKRAWFPTTERLVAEDTDSLIDMYEWAAGTLRLIELGNLEFLPNSDDWFQFSADGSRVFFESEVPLVPEDTDGIVDVYERANGQTRLVTAGTPTHARFPFLANALAAVSASGSQVLFETTSALVPEDTDTLRDDYLWEDGTIRLVSTGPGDTGTHAVTQEAEMARDGRIIFETAEPLLPEDTDTHIDVYSYASGVVTLRSPGSAAAGTREPAISQDGSHVFFHTFEALTPDDTDNQSDLYENVNGVTRLVSTGPQNVCPGGNTPCGAIFEAATPDGRHVVFNDGRRLVPEDTDSCRDSYERIDGTVTRLVTTGPTAGTSCKFHQRPLISDDGERIVFEHEESLVPEDRDQRECALDDGEGGTTPVNCTDVYERHAGVTTLLSIGPIGGAGASNAPFEGMSSDGSVVAFSTGEALFMSDADEAFDAHVRRVAPGYPRPAGGTPFRVPLVPAHQPCAAPNRTHAEPLAHPSCHPPVPSSPNLTVGVGDGDPAPALSIGFVRLSVRRGVPGGVDDAEVVIRSRLSNVMRFSDLSEFLGALRARLVVRLTDKDAAVSQTTQDFPLEWQMPCASTAATNEGSLCELTTTVDALIPGAAAEGARAVWALDRVRVYDGGPDEDAATTGDNSLLATQGVFVP